MRWCWCKRGIRTLESFSPTTSRPSVCDDLFVDDGQVFVRPFQFGPFLPSLDAALASVGATRDVPHTATSRAPRACFVRLSALVEREFLWRSVLSGTKAAMQDLPTPSLRHACGMTPDDGDGDDKHPLARKRLKIQALITTCVDTSVHLVLLQMHEQEGSCDLLRGG